MTLRKEVTQAVCPVKFEKRETCTKISEYFGINTFSEPKMEKMVSKHTFNAFKKWQSEGVVITPAQADEIANAMKEWAISCGATSYTHWFQPMTGLTAEKHDSFISFSATGQVLEEFSGNKLIQGEPDASSFPSGGLRATFEARGYTAWDPSSPAFITEASLSKTMCIPSIYISFSGAALDKKLPLLRSELAISRAAVELLTLFGHSAVKRVYTTCGAEQEYFLIDLKYAKLRPDLLLTGRTLIGNASAKDQQLEDQYLGSIKERILNYMNDVVEHAYKLGIPVATRHNEVAPHQFEFAPVYERANIAADHNLLLMTIMRTVAKHHNLECLLHEKPFAGVNGSGKHVNWSLADDTGNNLLNPGDTPEKNLLFLAVLTAVIHAVYKHADILRATVASAGNEHRLGANEAPPAIVSLFLGEQLTRITETLESGKLSKAKKQDIIDLGIASLPKFFRDTTDRNRTSTFAFTGSKFEFRAVGSSMNVSTSLTALNTIVADSLRIMTERIKAESGKSEFETAVLKVLSDVIRESKAIHFEGNNYSEEWIKEAAIRGLPNIASTPEALKALVKPKAIDLFERHGVFSSVELKARYHIWLEAYEKIMHIEAKSLVDIAKTMVLPPAYEYQSSVSSGCTNLSRSVHENGVTLDAGVLEDRKDFVAKISTDIYNVHANIRILEDMLNNARGLELENKTAYIFSDIKPQMELIRRYIDALESVMPDKLWELPKYREMLFID